MGGPRGTDISKMGSKGKKGSNRRERGKNFIFIVFFGLLGKARDYRKRSVGRVKWLAGGGEVGLGGFVFFCPKKGKGLREVVKACFSRYESSIDD